MTEHKEAPAGFAPMFRTSPFLDSIGTFYSKGIGAEMALGAFVDERAANARGTVHGGFLCALADVALGYALATSQTPPLRLTTVSLSIDFAGSVKVGDWIETSVDIQRVGGQVAYANAYLHVDNKRVVRASAVFVRAPADSDST